MCNACWRAYIFRKLQLNSHVWFLSKDSRVIIEGREACSRYLYYFVRYNIMMYFSYEYYMDNLFAALAAGYRKWHDFNFLPTSWRIKSHYISSHQSGFDLSDLVCRVLEWCARKYGKKSMSGQPYFKALPAWVIVPSSSFRQYRLIFRDLQECPPISGESALLLSNTVSICTKCCVLLSQ